MRNNFHIHFNLKIGLHKMKRELSHTSNEGKPSPPAPEILPGLDGVAASPCRKKRYLRVPFMIRKKKQLKIKGKETTNKDHEFEINSIDINYG